MYIEHMSVFYFTGHTYNIISIATSSQPVGSFVQAEFTEFLTEQNII